MQVERVSDVYLYVGGNPISRIDPMGLDWFRPAGAEYAAGRIGDKDFSPGPVGRGRYIDDYVPAGYTMAIEHDALVDGLVKAGLPDLIANVPTIPFVYRWAIKTELERSTLEMMDRIKSTTAEMIGRIANAFKPSLICVPF